MATHSITVAWEIPWTEEPCGLQSMGLQRVGLTEQLTLSLSVLHKLDKKFSSVQFSHSVVSDSLQSHEP